VPILTFYLLLNALDESRSRRIKHWNRFTRALPLCERPSGTSAILSTLLFCAG
jgi:hypothetical protein